MKKVVDIIIGLIAVSIGSVEAFKLVRQEVTDVTRNGKG